MALAVAVGRIESQLGWKRSAEDEGRQVALTVSE